MSSNLASLFLLLPSPDMGRAEDGGTLCAPLKDELARVAPSLRSVIQPQGTSGTFVQEHRDVQHFTGRPLQPTDQLLALRICSPGCRASHAMKKLRPGIKGSKVTVSPCSKLAQHLWLNEYWDCGAGRPMSLIRSVQWVQAFPVYRARGSDSTLNLSRGPNAW